MFRTAVGLSPVFSAKSGETQRVLLAVLMAGASTRQGDVLHPPHSIACDYVQQMQYDGGSRSGVVLM